MFKAIADALIKELCRALERQLLELNKHSNYSPPGPPSPPVPTMPTTDLSGKHHESTAVALK